MDTSNVASECKDFIKTSEDFNKMLHSYPLTNDNPACKELVEVFENFRAKLVPSHDPI
jgi:cell fate (sporulation/competence/biofilm development) regulator YlbF (YheA/YmcA/DUF963 family)